MNTKSGKQKGRRLQNAVANRLGQITGLPVGKDQVIAAREMGQAGTDIRLIGTALELVPFSIECKNAEKWTINQWIDQAKTNMIPNTDWLLVMKRNKHQPVVLMDAETFYKLLEQRIGISRYRN